MRTIPLGGLLTSFEEYMAADLSHKHIDLGGCGGSLLNSYDFLGVLWPDIILS